MAFTFGYTPQTPEGIARKRQIAQALMMQGMDTSPIQSPWQGAARIAQALVGGYQNSQAEQAAMKLQQEQEAKAKAAQAAADYEKRNTPEFKEINGDIYNWNPYMAEGGKPVLLSQAMQKADEWKKLNDGMMYRQGADGQPEYSQVPGGASNGLKPRDYTLGAPSGTKWKDPANVSEGVEPIPGYQKPVPSELAGKLAMMKIARKGIKDTRAALESDWGPVEFGQNLAASALPNWAGGDISMLSGKIGIAKRNVAMGTESALRVMTGAAAPDSEVARYAQMFTPGVGDTKESAEQKLNALEDFMDLAEKVSMAGRSGSFSLEDIDDYMAAKQAEREAAGVSAGEGGTKGPAVNTIEELSQALQEGQTATDTATGKRYTKRNGQIVEVQ